MSGAAAVGRDRCCRSQSPASRSVEGLCGRHQGSRGAPLRTLSFRGSAGGDLSRAARVLFGAVVLGGSLSHLRSHSERRTRRKGKPRIDREHFGICGFPPLRWGVRNDASGLAANLRSAEALQNFGGGKAVRDETGRDLEALDRVARLGVDAAVGFAPDVEAAADQLLLKLVALSA